MNAIKPSHQLVANNLTCVRGERILFKKLSFKLESGCALHVQGANGAGKTTLLRVLCGLSKPRIGEILWNNQNIDDLDEACHDKLLYLGHLIGIKDDLTPVENLQSLRSLQGFSLTREDAMSALSQLEITHCVDLPTWTLSQGQKRRVALSQLWLANLSSEMPLWILDEPFTALDANAIESLSLHIQQYVNSGGMVVMTSHQQLNFSNSLVKNLDLSV